MLISILFDPKEAAEVKKIVSAIERANQTVPIEPRESHLSVYTKVDIEVCETTLNDAVDILYKQAVIRKLTCSFTLAGLYEDVTGKRWNELNAGLRKSFGHRFKKLVNSRLVLGGPLVKVDDTRPAQPLYYTVVL